MTASASKFLLHHSEHDTPLEAQRAVLAAAFDVALPLHSMVAAVAVGRGKPVSAALATRAYAEQLPATSEAFARALAAPSSGGLLLFMTDGRRSTAGMVALAGCLEAKQSPETILYCPLCAAA